MHPVVFLLLGAALGLLIGLAVGKQYAASRPPTPEPPPPPLSRKSDEVVKLRESFEAQHEALRQEQVRSEQMTRKLSYLSDVLGMPRSSHLPEDAMYSASQDQLREALIEIESLKSGRVAALLDPRGFVIVGDDHDPLVSALSVLTGIAQATGCFEAGEGVHLRCTRGQFLTLRCLRSPQGTLPLIAAIWTSGVETPSTVLERLALRFQPLPERPELPRLADVDTAMSQGLRQLIRDRGVASLHLMTPGDSFYLAGNHDATIDDWSLWRRAKKLLELRSELGLGELEEIFITSSSVTRGLRRVPKIHGWPLLLSVDFLSSETLPRSILERTTTRLSWELDLPSNPTPAASPVGPELVATGGA